MHLKPHHFAGRGKRQEVTVHRWDLQQVKVPAVRPDHLSSIFGTPLVEKRMYPFLQVFL